MDDTLRITNPDTGEPGPSITEIPAVFGSVTGMRFTVVRYKIGAHGPFQDSYKLGADSPEEIKAGIAKRVQQLRSTLSGFGA